MKPKDKICVIGLWHLGCVTSSCLADAGYDVCGVDFATEVINNLTKGKPPLYEPGLEELLVKNLKSKRVSFTNSFKDALDKAKFIFLTFDTPVDEKDRLDLSIIYSACEKIAKFAPEKFTLVIMSQIPVGTSKILKEFILKMNKRISFDVIYSPENLRLGQALKGFRKPDRLILGLENETLKKEIERLYFFIKSPKIYMNLNSAEMVKHAINSYLAGSISFINEIAGLCEVTDADAMKVAQGMKSDKRIGEYAFLNPGLGFSGGTLARDLQALRKIGESKGVKTQIINSILEVNQEQDKKLIKKIKSIFGSISKLNITILGLTYKPGTSTLRRSAALKIAQKLIFYKANVKAFDPMVDTQKIVTGLKIFKNPYDAVRNADIVLLITEWPEFKNLNFSKIKKLMRKPIIIDSKNFLDPKILKDIGFDYYGIGVKN
ncbi:nucleotide sugar dehydrogenase [Patescibacteria group bacterium]|nr:nucleotide sugar dehydrogenase [Patescibacteria group bacterium]MBU4023305.1 nucleotide sugar dehydrogenase [Patescibacteria group bacterium]MBU4078154.1 nucleotide sugar dehydrogenase [Patescibacteria group bacterium]